MNRNGTKGVIAVCILAGLLGCSGVSQKELQAAVDPLNAKNYPQAVDNLSRLEKRFPGNAQIAYYLAFAHFKKGDFATAERYVDKTLALDARYKAVVGDTDMANYLAGNSDTSKDPWFRLAVKELEKIIALHPKSEIAERIRYHLANTYLSKRDYAAALQELQTVIAKSPETPFDRLAHLDMGNIYLQYLDNEDAGRKEYEFIVGHYPGSEEAAEAIFDLADFDRNKMTALLDRARTLREFAQKWEHDATLGKETAAAREQLQKDQRLAADYKAKAAAGYGKIVSSYRNSAFVARAQARLSQL